MGGSQRKRLLGAVVACLLSLPVSYAIAQEIRSAEPAIEEQSDVVPAEACPEEVNAAFEAVGLPRDSFGPSCPSVEHAREDAGYLHDLRVEGLRQIASSIRSHGGPADQETLAEIEAELQQLQAGDDSR